MEKHIVDIAYDQIQPNLYGYQLEAAREIVNALVKSNLDIHESAEVLDFCKESINRSLVARGYIIAG